MKIRFWKDKENLTLGTQIIVLGVHQLARNRSVT